MTSNSPIYIYDAPSKMWKAPGRLSLPTDAPPPPPPPAPEPGMLLGLSEWSQYADGWQIKRDLAAVDSRAVIQCVRRYDNGSIPMSFAGSKAAQDVGTPQASWISYAGPSIQAINSGSEDARLAGYFSSIPAGHRVFFTYKHETNNNKDDAKLQGATIAQFVSASARIWGFKQSYAADPDMVSVGPILTAEPYRDGTFRAYFPSGGEFDFIGADPYRFYREPGCPPDPKLKNSINADGSQGRPRTMQYLIGQMPAFSTETGKPIAIGEYGAHPLTTDLTARANWLNQTDAYLRSLDTAVACYFHSANGESGPWWLDRWHFDVGGRLAGDPDPTSLNAFANLLVSHPRSTP